MKELTDFVTALLAAPESKLLILFGLAIIGLLFLWVRDHNRIEELKEQIKLKKTENEIEEDKAQRQHETDLYASLDDIAANNILLKLLRDDIAGLHTMMEMHSEISDGRWLPIQGLLQEVHTRLVNTDAKVKEELMRQNATLRQMSSSKDEIIKGLEDRIEILINHRE